MTHQEPDTSDGDVKFTLTFPCVPDFESIREYLETPTHRNVLAAYHKGVHDGYDAAESCPSRTMSIGDPIYFFCGLFVGLAGAVIEVWMFK